MIPMTTCAAPVPAYSFLQVTQTVCKIASLAQTLADKRSKTAKIMVRAKGNQTVRHLKGRMSSSSRQQASAHCCRRCCMSPVKNNVLSTKPMLRTHCCRDRKTHVSLSAGFGDPHVPVEALPIYWHRFLASNEGSKHASTMKLKATRRETLAGSSKFPLFGGRGTWLKGG